MIDSIADRELLLHLEAHRALTGRSDLSTFDDARARLHAEAETRAGETPGERRLLAVAALIDPPGTTRTADELADLCLRTLRQRDEVRDERTPMGLDLLPASLTIAGRADDADSAAGPMTIPTLWKLVAVLAPTYARLEHAESLVELGAALRRANRRGDAREPLRQGMDIAVLSSVDSLAASKRRVAQLAGAGRTNGEIAQDLFVTLNTVESHMRHVFQKLGHHEPDGAGRAPPLRHAGGLGAHPRRSTSGPIVRKRTLPVGDCVSRQPSANRPEAAVRQGSAARRSCAPHPSL